MIEDGAPLEGHIIPPDRPATLDDMLDGREISPVMRRLYQAFIDGEPLPPVTVPTEFDLTAPEGGIYTSLLTGMDIIDPHPSHWMILGGGL